jgi:hypothetical protein
VEEVALPTGDTLEDVDRLDGLDEPKRALVLTGDAVSPPPLDMGELLELAEPDKV